MADNGFKDAELIRGEWGGINNDIRSHVWLFYDGIDIDITANQFNNIGYNYPAVFFSKKNSFHSSFKTVNDGIADFRVHLKKYANIANLEQEFQYTYQMILEKLLEIEINMFEL